MSWLKKHFVNFLWRVAKYAKYDRIERELVKLKSLPRYTHGSLDLFGHQIEFVDAASCFFMYQEIFRQQIYKFPTQHRNPMILDCGANIGLSTIYFKQLYPESHIMAFEPDRQIFKTLEQNIHQFSFTDVTLVNKAVWDSETLLEFMADGADAGKVVEGSLTSETYQVSTVRLSEYLKQPVNFLKLDIEGGETVVLLDCQESLGNVERLFVEYHSFIHQEQTLAIILEILSKAGFRIHIHSQHPSLRPFWLRKILFEMDMQINIFAFRD